MMSLWINLRLCALFLCAAFGVALAAEPDLAAIGVRYRRSCAVCHGAKGHGADHLVPALISPSLTVPVFGGQPALGTWQSIVLVDLNVDNPERQVILSFIGGQATEDRRG